MTLSGWHGKIFSCGTKEVLLKVVAQAIPSYAMNVFRLTLTLSTDIERRFTVFWWGYTAKKQRIHWMG